MVSQRGPDRVAVAGRCRRCACGVGGTVCTRAAYRGRGIRDDAVRLCVDGWAGSGRPSLSAHFNRTLRFLRSGTGRQSSPVQGADGLDLLGTLRASQRRLVSNRSVLLIRRRICTTHWDTEEKSPVASRRSVCVLRSALAGQSRLGENSPALRRFPLTERPHPSTRLLGHKMCRHVVAAPGRGSGRCLGVPTCGPATHPVAGPSRSKNGNAGTGRARVEIREEGVHFLWCQRVLF